MAHPQALQMWAVMQANQSQRAQWAGPLPRRPVYSAAQVSDEDSARSAPLVSARDEAILKALRRPARRLAIALASTANRRRPPRPAVRSREVVT